MPSHGKSSQLKRLRDGALMEISDSIIAGRHSSCGLSLSHEEGASRKHARFNFKDGQLTITDLGSLNGTLVNGVEIDATHVLENSDVIIFDTDKYLLSISPMKHAPEATSSTADTVIANKAERFNPDSIASAIRIIADEPSSAQVDIHTEHQASNTVEYLSSQPAPDMKRPVAMPEHNSKKNRARSSAANIMAMLTNKWLLLVFVLLALMFIAYQLGLRATL
ncbi:MAG: FHA domain-containing protein [Granulosicoccaceae bacterium]